MQGWAPAFLGGLRCAVAGPVIRALVGGAAGALLGGAVGCGASSTLRAPSSAPPRPPHWLRYHPRASAEAAWRVSVLRPEPDAEQALALIWRLLDVLRRGASAQLTPLFASGAELLSAPALTARSAVGVWRERLAGTQGWSGPMVGPWDVEVAGPDAQPGRVAGRGADWAASARRELGAAADQWVLRVTAEDSRGRISWHLTARGDRGRLRIGRMIER